MKTTPTHALQNGVILKKTYQITAFISSGGFGITYKASHLTLPFSYVIKEFFINGKCVRDTQKVEIQGISADEFAHFKKTFLEEAVTIAKLHENEHIVNIQDYFEENGTAYFVMPYVVSEDMEQYLRKQPYERVSESEAIGYITQLCHALQAAHALNIIHRDIKPYVCT
jgi:serine/threonine protein kinase